MDAIYLPRPVVSIPRIIKDLQRSALFTKFPEQLNEKTCNAWLCFDSHHKAPTSDPFCSTSFVGDMGLNSATAVFAGLILSFFYNQTADVNAPTITDVIQDGVGKHVIYISNECAFIISSRI